ncbi:MAG: DNA cytosine methyltransferase [Rubrivivax sp.]
MLKQVVKTVLHLFGATGAGARGFQHARAQVAGMEGRWECLGSMDIDAKANRVFARRIGATAIDIDFADRSQYIAINGHEPPTGWREATPGDLHRASRGRRPDAIFLSAPCKGFSGLLPESKSINPKYTAMNGLAQRALWLVLEAWRDDPVPMLLFENVPRLLTRGRAFADQLLGMLAAYGYISRETVHDCGELGGLGQSRKRCLIVVRHPEKVPNFLYEPPRRPLRSVGDVIGRLWLPGDDAAGPMHRVPRLHWKTWIRLAFVEAGSDWRSLNKLAVEDGHLRDFLIVPQMHHGSYCVRKWDEPCGTVQAASRPSNGRFSVADPRMFSKLQGTGYMGVRQWDVPGGTVTANGRPGAGAFSIADPRVTEHANYSHAGYRVTSWQQTAGTITGAVAPGSSAQQVADPRCGQVRHNNVFRVVRWDRAAGTVTSGQTPSSGGQCVADPRATQDGRLFGKYHCTGWDGPSRTVIGGDDNGAYAVADPRPEWNRHGNNLSVGTWDRPSRTVISGGKGVQGGWLSVADPRVGMDPQRGAYLSGGHYGVTRWDAPTGAVSASACHDNGPWSVADPRGLPPPDEKMVAVIRSLDDTWHRPFTTLELAALQSLFDPEDPADIAAFTDAMTADTLSDSQHREWIGNAVPSASATAIATEILRTLMLADAGETFALSDVPVWVRPYVAALQLAGGGDAT